LLDSFEEELYAASGLVEEGKYAELFERYVQHVSVWVKKERILNRLTGQYEDPDEKLMGEVERLLDVKGDGGEARKQMISAIAAWSLDHTTEKVEARKVFPHFLRRIREAMYAERRTAVAKLARDVVVLSRDEGEGLDAQHKADARACLDRMTRLFGYCEHCAIDAASLTLRKRFGELIV
jgi:predicted Ser/Thr protein kinase